MAAIPLRRDALPGEENDAVAFPGSGPASDTIGSTIRIEGGRIVSH
ncbi:hypothetical protein [Falsigemmobacter faecalis]|nr:hypothetical protein [Falsigemmobacter faecalis]